MGQIAIALESRVCICGCGRAFTTMPDSKQVYARAQCAGRPPAPQYAFRDHFPTKEEKALEATRKERERGIVQEAKRSRSKVRPRPGGDWRIEWDRLVSRAKELVLQMNRFRMEVAQCAIDACDIRKGGGGHWTKHQGIRTLQSFSVEVGISYKTLHTWVEIKKKVVDRLPEGVYDETNFGAARRTLHRIRRKDGAGSEDVGSTYDSELGRVGSRYDMFQILKTMRRITNQLAMLELTLCEDSDKEDLLRHARRMVNILEEDKNTSA